MASRSISFRMATPDTASAVAELVNSTYRGDTSRAGWTTEADLLGGQRIDRDMLQELVADPESRVLLCLQHVSLIGVVHVQRDGEYAYIGMLTVRPGMQGQGVGTLLLQEAEACARREWGISRFVMTVITRRCELIAYYERRGYRRTGEFKSFPAETRYGIPLVDDLRLAVLEKRG